MKKITVTINIKAGSKYQEDFARKCLNMMMEAFKLYFNINHKKNNTDYTITEE